MPRREPRVPPKEEKSWEKAGWTREPRNGYEWKRMREGKPQPQEKDRRWKKPYKCRKCGGKKYKVRMVAGRAARECIPCRDAYRKRRYQQNKSEAHRASREHRIRLRDYKPVFFEGSASVSATWLREHLSNLTTHIEEGILTVELYGEPAFCIVTLEQGREVLRQEERKKR